MGNTRRLLLRKNVKKPDRTIWTGKVCRMDPDGNSSLTDTDGSVTRSCREINKERMQLIIQPDGERGTRMIFAIKMRPGELLYSTRFSEMWS